MCIFIFELEYSWLIVLYLCQVYGIVIQYIYRWYSIKSYYKKIAVIPGANAMYPVVYT